MPQRTTQEQRQAAYEKGQAALFNVNPYRPGTRLAHPDMYQAFERGYMGEDLNEGGFVTDPDPTQYLYNAFTLHLTD